uniref:Uncharacterized protein n=1 Tax=viral metagenome TaxID=1070528 RepID=A0A6M3LMP5_9ZZZZ
MTNLEDAKKWLAQSRAKEKEVASTIQGKALLTIDHLLSKIDIGEDKLLNQIYMIAHSATGTCGNPHADWKRETAKLYKRLSRND